LNAVIIECLTREDIEGFVATAVAHGILSNYQDVSAAPAVWAVFAKPYNFRSHWELLGAGSGTEPLPKDQALPVDIPEEVIRQLEEICRL
jgi:hypothetical protein